MTRKQADKLENAINAFIIALLDEINYPNQHYGDHKSYMKVCAKTTRKRRNITKIIENLVKEKNDKKTNTLDKIQSKEKM